MNSINKAVLPALLALPISAFAADPVNISGLMQVDASFGKNFQKNSVSDIILRKIELGLDNQINERTSFHMLLEHEDGESGMRVTEGSITISLNHGLYITGGRMVVPFGIFETNMISDTLTKGLGEAHEDAVLMGFERDGLYGSLYVFNGDSIETSTALNGDDKTEHYGANIGYIFKRDEMSLDFGADYISTIADTNTVFDTFLPNIDTNNDATLDTAALDNYVSGVALHAVYNNGPWSAIAEHIKSDKFLATELNFNGLGAEPSATNIEGAYKFAWGSLAIAHQTTDEAIALDLPEKRLMVSTSIDLLENSTLKIEYAKDDDYSIDVGGTGEKADNLTFQLAVTF